MPIFRRPPLALTALTVLTLGVLAVRAMRRTNVRG